MKKILSVLAISLLAISMNAQNAFLNAGFETWTGGLPTNWNTLTIPIAGNLSNISKSTDANSGSFAVKIAAKTLPVTISGMTTAPGLLTNGTLDVMGLAQMDFENIDFTQLSSLITNGTLLTERPTTVSGYYSWNPVNENYEQFIFATLVISNASGTREVVGIANYTNVPEFTGSMKATYASFESEITYLNPTATPTELVFLAITMNADLNATSFGYLLLDDVSMTTQIGLEKITNDTKTPLVIYPNPTSGEFRLNVKSNVEVSVYNQLGQVVIPPMNYSPNTKVSVKEKGIYFVRIKDAKGTKTQKLIVK
ncbi:MAG: T9SS type A sorting domain-containing protein [Bacteroidales bacterium]|nr:T9SS type A sorting domain-containing protein [Bacteroidales bacterium]